MAAPLARWWFDLLGLKVKTSSFDLMSKVSSHNGDSDDLLMMAMAMHFNASNS